MMVALPDNVSVVGCPIADCLPASSVPVDSGYHPGYGRGSRGFPSEMKRQSLNILIKKKAQFLLKLVGKSVTFFFRECHIMCKFS